MSPPKKSKHKKYNYNIERYLKKMLILHSVPLTEPVHDRVPVVLPLGGEGALAAAAAVRALEKK